MKEEKESMKEVSKGILNDTAYRKKCAKAYATIPHGMQGRLFIVVDTSRQESYDKCICSMTQTESVSGTL